MFFALIRRAIFVPCVAAIAFFNAEAKAQPWNFNPQVGTFTYDWNTPATWLRAGIVNGIPNAAGAVANLNATLAGNTTLNLGATVTVGEILVGDVNYTYTIAGNSGTTLQIEATNASIATVANSRDVFISANVAVQNNTTLTIANNSSAGALQFTGSSFTVSNSNLTFSGSGNISFANGISGNVNQFQKSGSGILRLGGTNTYNGTTNVTAGSLIVNGSLTSSVSLSAGTTLGGNGTITGSINGPNTSFINAGDPAINSGVGTLTIGNFNTVGFRFDLNGAGAGTGYDRVATSGGLNLNGNIPASFTTTSSNLSAVTSMIPLTTTGSINGTFTGMPNNSTITIAGINGGISHTATISYVNASGVMLTNFAPVPEPTTILGLGAAAMGLAGLRRRRRKVVS